MGILEQIQQMKNQGMPDEEIIRNLQEQGISPGQINDALNQSKIKRAVVDEKDMEPTGQYAPAPGQARENYAPQTQEMPATPSTQETYPAQQEYYQQGDYGGYPQAIDSDTIIGIAEQVFSEKIKKIQKQADDMNEFKTLAQTKIENMEERLKRIETSIDKLQMAILEKIGSYGNNINSIKNPVCIRSAEKEYYIFSIKKISEYTIEYYKEF